MDSQTFWAAAAVIATIVVGLLVPAANRILDARSKNEDAKRIACVEFRAAFAEAITQIDHQSPHHLMNKLRAIHDASIFKFRAFVPIPQHHRFDKTVDAFKRCREKLTPNVFFAMNAELDWEREKEEMKAALNALLDFASLNN